MNLHYQTHPHHKDVSRRWVAGKQFQRLHILLEVFDSQLECDDTLLLRLHTFQDGVDQCIRVAPQQATTVLEVLEEDVNARVFHRHIVATRIIQKEFLNYKKNLKPKSFQINLK